MTQAEHTQLQPAISHKVEELRRELSRLTAQLKDISSQVGEKAHEAVDVTREWTREHPLTALGVSASAGLAIGFLLGMLVSRR